MKHDDFRCERNRLYRMHNQMLVVLTCVGFIMSVLWKFPEASAIHWPSLARGAFYFSLVARIGEIISDHLAMRIALNTSKTQKQT